MLAGGAEHQASVQATKMESRGSIRWGYTATSCRPDEWPKYYATGKRQSPINVIVGCHPNQLSSTCCAYSPIEADLSAQVMSDARVCLVHKNQHRQHLNSTGDDSDLNRSASSSSGSSCSSPSPNHRLVSGSNRDEDGDANGNHATGKRQALGRKSDFYMQNTRHCVTNKKIFLGYPRYLNSMQLSNTGHNWQVDLAPEISVNTLLRGPPFGNYEYRLAQFHCHWGIDNDHGSEHQINGRSFAAELHFVHWNCSLFRDISEASKHQHGLAVLGVLVQALDGEQHRNKNLDKIITGLSSVREPGSDTEISPRLDLKKLFPANRWIYASYEGSLTTPPLSEVVDWVLFLSPITCSSSQIEQFRKLKCSTGAGTRECLVENCRPVQPLHDRLVSVWTHH